MNSGPRSFDPEKAVEAILYTTSKAGTTLYETLKLIYIADKCHLERYGRFIFGDVYAALEHGPVGSDAYDAMKQARGTRSTSRAPSIVDAIKVDPKTQKITVLREPNLDELSATDIECLDEAISKYGRWDFARLKKLTHDAAYDATLLNQKMAIEAIAATLAGAPELIQYLSDPHPDRAR
jgi:uncharacterized phage-associated protein